MAIVLTVAPLGGSDLSDWMGGWAKRQGGEVIRVPGGAGRGLVVTHTHIRRAA